MYTHTYNNYKSKEAFEAAARGSDVARMARAKQRLKLCIMMIILVVIISNTISSNSNN